MRDTDAITDFLERHHIEIYIVPVEGIDKNPRHPQAHFKVWIEGPTHSFDTEHSVLKERPTFGKLTVDRVVEGFAYACARREGRDFEAWFKEAPYRDLAVATEHGTRAAACTTA
ncbi:hypothetical protein [Ensifer sp. R-19]|uniref:hypothetical protein n=1 Tax=Ensifer sp. R-19 TaxID=3404055 RepID=UPI003CE80870